MVLGIFYNQLGNRLGIGWYEIITKVESMANKFSFMLSTFIVLATPLPWQHAELPCFSGDGTIYYT